MQANRFEQLAKNKDIVEEVKQEARENGEFASRTKILNLVQARKQAQEKQIDDYHDYCKRLDSWHKTYNKFVDAVELITRLNGETLEDMLLNFDKTITEYVLERLTKCSDQINQLKYEINEHKRKIKGTERWNRWEEK